MATIKATYLSQSRNTIQVVNYTFAFSAKTITFTDYVSIDLKRIKSVYNLTRDVMYFLAVLGGPTGTVATNVLTLAAGTSTTGHADADVLIIYYEDLPQRMDLTLDQVTSQNIKITVANTPSILTAAGTALASNVNRKKWRIQNLGTNPLFVRLAASASTTVFHFILKAGTANDDGLGEVFTDEVYTGLVTVAGTSPRFVVTEL